MNSLKYPNEAIRILRVKHAGTRAVARAAGVTPRAAVRWFAGTAKPESDRRHMLKDAFGVDPSAWDREARTNAALRLEALNNADIVDKSPPVLAAPIDLDAPGASRALGISALRRAQADTARLRSARATPDEIVRAEMAELRATVYFARLSGDFNQTEEQRLVRSSAWRSIRARMLDALAPHPQALAAVRAALALEGA